MSIWELNESIDQFVHDNLAYFVRDALFRMAKDGNLSRQRQLAVLDGAIAFSTGTMPLEEQEKLRNIRSQFIGDYYD